MQSTLKWAGASKPNHTEMFSTSEARLDSARAVLLVLDSSKDTSLPVQLMARAAKHGASIDIYDLHTGSFWTTPYEDDDEGNWSRDRGLTSPQLRGLGHDGTAEVIDAADRLGHHCRAHLATSSGAGDIRDLTKRRHINAVVVTQRLGWFATRNIAALARDGISVITPVDFASA